MMRIWYDQENQLLSVQDVSSQQVKTLQDQHQIKRFLLAHGLKLDQLTGTVYVNDMTGLFQHGKKNVIPYTTKK